MHQLLSKFNELELEKWLPEIADLVRRKKELLDQNYGHEKRLKKIFSKLPKAVASTQNFSADTVKIGAQGDLDQGDTKRLISILQSMLPWRKGPFQLFGIDIDTEWDSSIKWKRLERLISPLKNRRILDIGCNSGYYMFKMLPQEPKMVLGVDPFPSFYYQFRTLENYAGTDKLFVVPSTFEELPVLDNYFDTIFSMGVLYHRRSPVDSLCDIHKFLRKGGELVLETLVIEGDTETCLFPEDRYAKMRNVFFLPTVKCLTFWLKRAGFSNIRCVDISVTTPDEQRKTEWIESESLSDFLDPDDPTKTVEGYPAPIRAIILADA